MLTDPARHLGTRVLFSILLLTAGVTAAAAQPAVIIVRHAERADAGTPAAKMTGADPDLSPAGAARAERLAALLKDAGVTAIFTTERKRTRQTAAPLAKTLGLTPIVVAADDTAALVGKLREATGTVLVVGHSNTIPDIVGQLGVTQPVKIDDMEFDNLLVLFRGASPVLLRLHY